MSTIIFIWFYIFFHFKVIYMFASTLFSILKYILHIIQSTMYICTLHFETERYNKAILQIVSIYLKFKNRKEKCGNYYAIYYLKL